MFKLLHMLSQIAKDPIQPFLCEVDAKGTLNNIRLKRDNSSLNFC